MFVRQRSPQKKANKPKPMKGCDKLLNEITYCCLICVLRMSNLSCGAARPCLLHAAASARVFRFDKSFAVFAWQRLEIFLSIWWFCFQVSLQQRVFSNSARESPLDASESFGGYSVILGKKHRLTPPGISLRYGVGISIILVILLSSIATTEGIQQFR